jgi:hypothetical protein
MEIDRILSSIFGTSDLTCIKGDHMDVLDWKFGRNAVDPPDVNIQGLAYALGAMDKYPQCKTVTVHFVLPRRGETFSHTFTRDELEEARFRIRLIIERATQSEPKLNPNTDSCRYCGRRVDCPALADRMLPLAKKAQSSVEDFEIAMWESANPALVTDADTIGKMKRVGNVIENWKKAVDKRALELAHEEGLEIPGFSIYFRSPSIKLDSAVETFEALKDSLTPEKFQEACSVSLPLLAKIYADSRGVTQKKARSELENLLAKAGLISSEDERIKTPYLRASRN